MIISKSDYIKYCQCPKLLWLYKNRKDLIPEDIGKRIAGLAQNGEEIEKEAYKLFPEGVKAENQGFKEGPAETGRLIAGGAPVIFQGSFWKRGLYCRADIMVRNQDNDTWDIYEVKSAVKIKPEYLPDLAFQKICLETAGLRVNKTWIIYVNGEYVRQGNIVPEEFLRIEDLSEETDKIAGKTAGDIKDMFELAPAPEEPAVKILKQCHNPYPCPFIDYCWQNVPKHSIYNVYPSEKEISRLLDDNIVDLSDVPAGVITKDKYLKYYEALKKDEIYIDRKAIKKELKKYRFPIYFLDYETNNPGLPRYDGFRPYQQMPFQYSLHVLEAPAAKLKHFEYLAEKDEDPVPGLAGALSGQIGSRGSVVAWYKKFEAGRNREMGEHSGEYEQFFQSINDRILDLMDFFANGYYVDKNFFGSSSLKKVLPVIAPHLSYQDLNIQEGMSASESWLKLISGSIKKEDKENLKSDMLAYCRLDTLAMVEIFIFLNKQVY